MEAAKLIMQAERPVLYVGGGMLKARAAEALRELVDLTGIHVKRAKSRLLSFEY